MRLSILLFALCSLLATGAARAQAIVLKDGSKIFSTEFALEDGKIIRTVKIGENTATSIVQFANIDSLEWPYPTELTDSADLLAKGKVDEAIVILEKAKAFFEVFKGVEGNWYVDVYFAYVEALNQGGRFDDVLKVMPLLRALKLTDEQKMRLRIVQLDIERKTSSDYLTIITEARSILKETDDSAIGASIWNIIADVHVKKKEYEPALLAYLRIPVFYGTQMQKVPDAELNAALTLIKMRRFADATAFLTRIIAAYPGSQVAERAAKQKASIAGMGNEDEKVPAADEKSDKEGKSDKKTAETTTAETKPDEEAKK